MVGLPLFGKEASGTPVFKILVRALIQRLYVSVALVLIHTNYCFGHIMLLSDRTIMGVRRYQTLSEDTIHPTEHYYWPVFIVNNYILDPGLM